MKEVELFDVSGIRKMVNQRTANETVLWSKMVPAGMLNSRNCLRLSMQFGTCTFKGCAEDTVPEGVQNLTLAHYYDDSSGIPAGSITNATGQLSYITRDAFGKESFVATVSYVSGFSVPYPPGSSNLQIIQGNGDDITVIATPALPASASALFYGQSTQAAPNGHSDEPSFMFFMNGITPNPLTGTGSLDAWSYYSMTTGTWKFFTGDTLGVYTKRGNSFWNLQNATSARVNRYDASGSGGGPATFYHDAAWTNFTDNGQGLDSTALYVYLLYYNPATSTSWIYRLDPTAMTIVASWDLGIRVEKFDVLTDDMIYLFIPNNFYYFQPSTATLGFVGTVTGSVGSAGSGFHFSQGYFYLSNYSGFAGGSAGIFKVGPVVCPDSHMPVGADRSQ